jgi:checkpoint serine/threonine-protein kinase
VIRDRPTAVAAAHQLFVVKAKLDSPSKPKMRKNKSSEPTMTLHTKAATDEIYDLFNAPLQSSQEDNQSDDDEYMTDGDYTSGGESTCTTRQIAMSDVSDDEVSDAKSLSEWSDFTARKHIPVVNGEDVGMESEERDDTRVSDLVADNDDEQSGQFSSEVSGHMQDRNLTTPTEEEDPKTLTRFVPIPPEDYVPNSRPFRDPAEVANNRLPFMTPITERTESSLGFITGAKSRYTNTPASSDHILEEDEEDDEDFGPISSPLREILGDNRSPVKIAQPVLQRPAAKQSAPTISKGPIIADLQCNPVDEAIREEILRGMHPPLSFYPGFFDHRDVRCNRGAEVRKFAKSNSKPNKTGNSDRSSIGNPIVLEFPEVKSTYTLKRELGAGAFAPVYLVENSCADQEPEDEEPLAQMGKGAFAVSHRSAQEALKMELPPTAWEFHMMRLAATRLGPQHRATASISAAHELHLYQDEGFLFLQYHPHGTLLDVVNFFREQPSGAMDEPLAMFFTIELLRTVEAMHSKQILHGDLKADNCLLRLDALGGEQSLSSQWHPNGSGGWSSRGIVLIDFGRGIDMRAFDPDVQFIADWKTTAADCAEMREGRPWTWQIDYHGLAGIIHCLLFGRYIETVRCDQGGLGTTAGRKYKIRESLKRYWQTDIWGGCFDLLLNPGGFAEHEDGARMPVMRSLKRVREQMEDWLEANCEKGLGLKALMGRVEGFASARSRK